MYVLLTAYVKGDANLPGWNTTVLRISVKTTGAIEEHPEIISELQI